jgi:PAS domain S-box-containing protein
MRNIINDPELKKYLETYAEGKAVFLEGDESKDLYFLVHGNLKLLKNKKQIGEIFKSGEMIGEMSYLIDSKRTATIIAHTDASLLRIPEAEISDFIKQHPEVSHKIIETLAQRLKDTTQVAHGLKEFCDQLPDAVVMTDTSNKIMAWNKAAESLHGRVWQEMKGQSISDVFQNPEEYRQFIDDVQAGHHLQEKVLLIKHPEGGDCYVSTSTTVIYDGHFNIAGYIFLSRNVTKMKQLEDKYRSIKKFFIPVFLTIAVLLGLIFAGMSTFSKGVKILDHRKKSFQTRIMRDYQALQTDYKISADKGNEINKDLEQYFKENHPDEFAIRGLLVLNAEKKVIAAYSPAPGNNRSLIGSNYSGVKFSGTNGASCNLLNIYRTDKNNPMGAECSELAFKIDVQGRKSPNWLVFQMDMDYLQKEFGIDKKILSKINFAAE